MDKRWCENCGKSSDVKRVDWYLFTGAEVSLCKPCATIIGENETLELIK